MSVYHSDLQCQVEETQYSRELKTGSIFMPEGHCVDMSAAIRFFTEMDPEVETILTFSGDQADTIYKKHMRLASAYELVTKDPDEIQYHEWRAYAPR